MIVGSFSFLQTTTKIDFLKLLEVDKSHQMLIS